MVKKTDSLTSGCVWPGIPSAYLNDHLWVGPVPLQNAIRFQCHQSSFPGFFHQNPACSFPYCVLLRMNPIYEGYLAGLDNQPSERCEAWSISKRGQEMERTALWKPRRGSLESGREGEMHPNCWKCMELDEKTWFVSKPWQLPREELRGNEWTGENGNHSPTMHI